MTQKITPLDHPDFVGGWIWTAMEIQWIEERITEAVSKEREAIWNILFEYAGRDDLTPEDESLLKHLADLIRARGQE